MIRLGAGRLAAYGALALPLAMAALPLYVHGSAVGRARLVCSAGRRGVQVALAGNDFMAASGATPADLIED